MFSKTTLKNGLTLITVPMPHLDSVTTLVAVGAGSRYESKKINGLSHFLEHMFFKGSRKYPSVEQIQTLLDGVGAINNAATGKEFTYYWIKSSAKNLELGIDILSSMLKESLLSEKEIEKEKGIIIEEMRMIRDDPARYIWTLYEMLLFGDQPLGWDIGGSESTIKVFTRQDFINYVDSLYSPGNMSLVVAGNFPKNIDKLAEKYFLGLPKRDKFKAAPFKKEKQNKLKTNLFFKHTDQAHLILGMEGFDRFNKKRYAARILGAILGEGMSSRLFLQVRERRGLAYHVSAGHDPYIDCGIFAVYAGLKMESMEEGLRVILAELQRITSEKVSVKELKKAKEMIRGRLAIRSESTNFLAEYFGTNFVLDRKLETFDEYLQKIDEVTVEDIQAVAQELFQKNKFNLQVIGPFKSKQPFEKVLNS